MVGHRWVLQMPSDEAYSATQPATARKAGDSLTVTKCLQIVEVELDGHASQRREVVIQGGRVTRIEFQLEPRPLKIDAEVNEMGLYFKGKDFERAEALWGVTTKKPAPPANQDWPEVERILYTDLSGKESGNSARHWTRQRRAASTSAPTPSVHYQSDVAVHCLSPSRWGCSPPKDSLPRGTIRDSSIGSNSDTLGRPRPSVPSFHNSLGGFDMRIMKLPVPLLTVVFVVVQAIASFGQMPAQESVPDPAKDLKRANWLHRVLEAQVQEARARAALLRAKVQAELAKSQIEAY